MSKNPTLQACPERAKASYLNALVRHVYSLAFLKSAYERRGLARLVQHENLEDLLARLNDLGHPQLLDPHRALIASYLPESLLQIDAFSKAEGTALLRRAEERLSRMLGHSLVSALRRDDQATETVLTPFLGASRRLEKANVSPGASGRPAVPSL